jgi:hypothetical protein
MRAIRNSAKIREISARPPSDHRSYLLSGRESFARAYSQFIAQESQRAPMVASLSNSRLEQWSTEDFAPIRAEFRGFLKSLGWMK